MVRLGKECVDCLVEGGGLVYLDNYDSVTRERGSILKFNSYAEPCDYLERVLGETQRGITVVLLSKTKDLGCKYAKKFFS